MAPQFQLIMRSGPTPGASFILEGDQLTVGRDSTNEIVINDAEISRRHSRNEGGQQIEHVAAHGGIGFSGHLDAADFFRDAHDARRQ